MTRMTQCAPLRSLPAGGAALGRELIIEAAGQPQPSGDHAADAIVARPRRENGAFVLSYSTGLLKDRYVAEEDVVQETMLQAWPHRGEFRRRALGWLSPSRGAVTGDVGPGDGASREAAARLGIPEGTAFSRSYYALRVLRQELVASLPGAGSAAA
jgi:hypothetical protein